MFSFTVSAEFTCIIIIIICPMKTFFKYRFIDFFLSMSSFHQAAACLGLLITAEWAVNDAFMVTLSAASALFDLNVSAHCSVTQRQRVLWAPAGFYFDRISVTRSIQAADEVEDRSLRGKMLALGVSTKHGYVKFTCFISTIILCSDNTSMRRISYQEERLVWYLSVTTAEWVPSFNCQNV